MKSIVGLLHKFLFLIRTKRLRVNFCASRPLKINYKNIGLAQCSEIRIGSYLIINGSVLLQKKVLDFQLAKTAL